MFSQRNNPYCELLQIVEQIYKNNFRNEKNIRTRSGNSINRMGIR